MALTPHQSDQFIAWIDEHWPDGLRCPLCQQTKWETGEIMTGLPVDPAAVTQLEGPINPLVQLRCRTCRNVLLFDAGPMGLMTPEG